MTRSSGTEGERRSSVPTFSLRRKRLERSKLSVGSRRNTRLWRCDSTGGGAPSSDRDRRGHQSAFAAAPRQTPRSSLGVAAIEDIPALRRQIAAILENEFHE